MTERKPTDGQIDQLVKARWLEIGLSHADLAEVLDAASDQLQNNDVQSNGVGIARLLQIAQALDLPLNFFRDVNIRQEEQGSSSAPVSAQALLELRLLRAFQQLRTQRTKHMLVHLAERIVKHQADGR
jgi:hypothetical protein